MHVGVAPVPQRHMGFLDGLGRRPAQDVVRTTRFVVGSCAERKEGP